MLKVLQKKKPDRPVLFELFLNGELYDMLSAGTFEYKNDGQDNNRRIIMSYYKAGYDYAPIRVLSYSAHIGEAKVQPRDKTISLNDGAIITDWESFEKIKWQDPANCSDEFFEKCVNFIPEGMKLMTVGTGGLLEGVIYFMGYDNLCLLIHDEPELVAQVFNTIGSNLLKYYQLSLEYDEVGGIISHDDWGFNTQTMLSPEDMRKYVFPWHKRIVEAAHAKGKPVILHSCGNMEEIADDIIYDMKFDGKHSYEDNIMPVEEAYKKYHDKFAVIGGIDVDFIVRRTPEEITERSLKMLELSDKDGSFALGTGNSVPTYIPPEKYFAMTKAAFM